MFYNTVIGWAVYYFISSIVSAGQYVAGSTESLPWTSCGNEWNDEATCTVLREVKGRNKSFFNISSPAEEYFQRGVLEIHKSDGLSRLGSIKPSLALSCL